MLTLEHYNNIMDNFKEGKNFAFARFNDGEMGGIQRVGFVAARGCQVVNESLHDALVKSLMHEQENYWKGFPCKVCFPQNKFYYDTFVNPYYQYQTYAVALCNNGHWKMFVQDFANHLHDRSINWIGSSDQNITVLSFYGNIDINIQVPNVNAWSVYDRLKGAVEQFKKDSIVVFSCGPIGRVLACEWFKERQDCTFFDAGSLFDPFTRNVWHGCHTGKLKYCPECNHE